MQALLDAGRMPDERARLSTWDAFSHRDLVIHLLQGGRTADELALIHWQRVGGRLDRDIVLNERTERTR